MTKIAASPALRLDEVFSSQTKNMGITRMYRSSTAPTTPKVAVTAGLYLLHRALYDVDNHPVNMVPRGPGA